MAAPTRVALIQPAVGFLSNASPKTTPTFNVTNGDLLVCVVQMEHGGTLNNAPTWTGTGTWTSRVVTSPVNANTARVVIYSCAVTATASGVTVSVANNTPATFYGFTVTQWQNHGGTGATAQTALSSGTTGLPSLGITTTQANSALQVGNDDWAAVDGATRTWRTVNGSALAESVYARNATNYGVYGGYSLDAGAIGTATVGLTAPAAQTYAICAIEILGTAGAAAVAPPVIIGQAINRASRW